MKDWHPNLGLFLVEVLAVWRLSYALHAEVGPWDLLARARSWVARVLQVRVLDCFYCLSVWVALPVAFVSETGWVERAGFWLGLAGGAALLQRATERTEAAAYYEEPLKDAATSASAAREE